LLSEFRDAKEAIRGRPISEYWRGTNYANFGPLPDLSLPLYIVAERTIQKSKIATELRGGYDPKSKERESGRFYHCIFSHLYQESRRFVLQNSRKTVLRDLEGYLESRRENIIRDVMGESYDSWTDVKENLMKIWFYESCLLLSRIYFFCSRYPDWSVTSLVDHVFRFKNEYQFDGSKFHLSENCQIDLYRQDGVNVVIDIKTGRPEEYHYLTVVGYALALESSPQEADKVDLGCIMYVNFVHSDPMPRIKCKFYPLFDSYRQDFIEELKQKLIWVAEDRPK